MRRATGKLKQEFEIKLDVEKLSKYIAEQVIAEINSKKYFDKANFSESYFEDYGYLVIAGSYETNYIYHRYDATLESPLEDEIDRNFLSDDDLDWLLEGLPDVFKKCMDIVDFEEDEEKVEHYEDNV